MNFLNRYTLSTGILLVAVVFSPDPGVMRIVRAAHDLAHAPIFGAITVFILIRLRRDRAAWSPGLQYGGAFALAVLLGAVTELVQGLTGRDPSWFDLRSDALGAAAFCAFAAMFDARITRGATRVACALLGIALLAMHAWPFTQVALTYAHRNQQFPTLFDAHDPKREGFVSPLRSQLRYAALPEAFATTRHEQALRVRFATGSWLGVDLDEPFPNWEGYMTLAVDMTNADDRALALAIRVHDRKHDERYEDRFNRNFSLPARSRMTYRIPLADVATAPRGRPMQMDAIEDLLVFTSGANAGRELYVSRIWLE